MLKVDLFQYKILNNFRSIKNGITNTALWSFSKASEETKHIFYIHDYIHVLRKTGSWISQTSTEKIL